MELCKRMLRYGVRTKESPIAIDEQLMTFGSLLLKTVLLLL